MPDGPLALISCRRTWVTGVLVLVIVFAQSAWVYSPVAAAPSFSTRSSIGTSSPERAQVSALPAWFGSTLRRNSELVQVTGLSAAPFRPDPAPGTPLPDWFRGGTLPRPFLQPSEPSLSKNASVVMASVDQVFTYTLVFTIPSGNTLTNVQIEDHLPDNDPWGGTEPDIRLNGTHGNYAGPIPLTGGTPSIDPGDVSVSSDNYNISWMLPDIANSSGQPYVYQITYQAKAYETILGFGWGEVGTNNATFSWSGGSDSDQVDVIIVRPDLLSRQIVVSPHETAANPTPPDSTIEGLRANDVITVYQILTNTIANHPGDVGPAYDIRVRYRLPDWLAFESMVSSHASPDTSTGGFGLNAYTQLDWLAASLGGSVPELNRLDPDDSVAIVFRARVNSNVAAGRSNTGQLMPYWYYYPGGGEETGPNRNVTLLSATPAMAKDEVDVLGDGELVISDLVTYTVIITMPGSGVTLYTPTIELRDTLHDGLSYVTALYTPTGWTAPVTTPDGNNTRITWKWQGGDINGSGTYTFSFLAQDDGFYNSGNPVPRGTALRNEARLRWGTHDEQTVESSLADVTVNHIRPQIEPNKSASPGSITEGGEQIVWTINNVQSQTPYGSTAWDIVLTDTLPPGFGFVGAYPAGYATTTVGSSVVVTWGVYVSLTEGSYLPAPSPDNFYRITTTAPITLAVGQTHQNHTTVRYSDRQKGQPNRQTYIYTRTASVDVSANLMQRFKYAAPSGDLRIGDSVLYTASVSLAPGTIAHWPRFYDELPSGIHYISPTLNMQGASLLTVTLGKSFSNRQTVEWYVSTLSNPTPATIYFTATFQARVTATDTNDALLFTSDNDMRRAVESDNRYSMRWNYTDRKGTPWDTPWEQSSDNTNNDIVQPFLVDRDPVKTLVSPAAGSMVQSGDLLTYHLTVYNTGRAAAYDVLISDTLPPGLTFDAYQARVYPYGGGSSLATASPAPSNGDRDTIGWVFGQVPAGDGTSGNPDTRLVVTYTVEAQDDVGSGATLANSAWISDYSSQPGAPLYERTYGDLPKIGTRYSGASVSVPEAGITKTASVTEAAIGGIVVFTITLPDPALAATLYNVTVTDTMPGPSPGPLHVLAAKAPGTTSFNVSSDTVAASYGSIAPGSPATIIITARVPVTAIGGLVSNVAQVVWDDAATGGVQHSAQSDSVEVVIIAPDVQVTKSAPGAAPQDYPLVYTIVYGNDGAATAYDVRLTDTLPISVTYVQSRTSRPITPVVGFPNPLAWELGDLSKDESGTIWLTTTVWLTAPLNGRMVNTVTIYTPTPGDDPLDNQDTTTTIVNGSFLQVAKSASPDPVQAGALLLYTILITNDGSLATESLVITDRVTSSTTFDSATGGVTPDVGGLLTWTPAPVAVGNRAEVTFAVRVDSPLVSGTKIVNNRYGASADNAPPIAPPPPVTVTVHSQPSLLIVKTAAATVDAGEDLVYTIRYRNGGNAVAHNVRITESYDLNVTFSAAVPSPDVGNNVWEIGPLTPTIGAYTIVVTTQVGVSVADGTLLTNTVIIDGDENEPQSDTASTRVGDYVVYMPVIMKNYSPPVYLGVNLVVQSIQVGPASPAVGQATRITVTLHNSGLNTITDDFWVDLYVDPSTTPTVNVVWNDIAPYGKAWLIHDDIPGGGTLVIHTDQLDDPNDPDAIYSNWPGWFVNAGERVLYAQVDSYGLATGLILEDDETDNVSGPLSVTVVPSNTLIAPPPPIQWQERR